jgi:superfamily II DNA or RNA helicase
MALPPDDLFPGAPSPPAREREPAAATGTCPPLVQLLAAAGVLGRTRFLELARDCGIREASGRAYTGETLAAALAALAREGMVGHGDAGYWCERAHLASAFVDAAATGRLAQWLPHLRTSLGLIRASYSGEIYFRTAGDAVAATRLALCALNDPKETERVLASVARTAANPAAVYRAALSDPFSPKLAGLMQPPWRDAALDALLGLEMSSPTAFAAQVVEWTAGLVASGKPPPSLRYRLAEHRLWQGRGVEALALLEGATDGFGLALRGMAAVLAGDAAAACELYAQSVRALRATDRRRSGLLPFSPAWLRAVALILTDAPAALEEAKRYARAEGRAGDTWIWGTMEALAEARLGDRRPGADPCRLSSHDGLADLVLIESAAWQRSKLERGAAEIARKWVAAYRSAGYERVAQEFEAALAVAGGEALPPGLAGTLAGAFAGEAQWRRALTVIAGLSDAERKDEAATRIAWVLREDGDGIVEIEPQEQRRGPRGWSKGKAVPLSRLAKSERVAPDDAPVARAVKRLGASIYELDTDRALAALVGHPRVFFESDLATPVELATGMPRLEVRPAKDGIVVTMYPDLRQAFARAPEAPWERASPAGNDRALLVRESATRARVVRLTAAHRRVAELIGGGLRVPAAGSDQLARAMEAAARFFEVHSAARTAAAEAPGDPAVHAELSPAGSGVRLRLGVRPLGPEGPRYAPGQGGMRVIAEVRGERRAVVRDLAAERQGARRVLDAASMLGRGDDSFEWRIEEPEDALALVEALQGLGNAVRVTWPEGKRLAVSRAYSTRDLRVSLRSGRDWLEVAGGLALDEGQVLEMRTIVEWARSARGRYVPLGEAGFVALTAELRERLEELAALAEAADGGVRVNPLAALAVEELASEAAIERDDAWAARIARIGEAAALEPSVPSTLQAALRGYQLEGFRWLARLAHWGGGACLADDMGLGKTVQALALLLSRAPAGPALVVAPTSVCPNWIDETRRFAPTLRVELFGAGDRARQLAAAGAFDVVVGSYALVQQEAELFAARRWHTIVLDEAQAVKNYAAKRTQAVLALAADFRMVTTGTPVENRLDELWTLFRFLNPGLLGSRERFQTRFAGPIERARDESARLRLRRLVRPFVLRRTKSEVLAELPPRTEIALGVEPEPRERAFHEALRRAAIEAIARATGHEGERRFRVLAELMRLRRAACDPRLVAPEAGVEGAKAAVFLELVEELIANRHKALVFSQFVDYLTILRGRLDGAGIRYQYLDGATPAADRAKRIAAFQAGEGDLFLISLRAGGFGLNLTAADYVIIADPWWNPAVEDQAAGRAHRIGQERPVTVYRLVLRGSIEERIVELHRDKRALAEGLFGGEDFGANVSVEELVRLIREAE